VRRGYGGAAGVRGRAGRPGTVPRVAQAFPHRGRRPRIHRAAGVRRGRGVAAACGTAAPGVWHTGGRGRRRHATGETFFFLRLWRHERWNARVLGGRVGQSSPAGRTGEDPGAAGPVERRV